MYRANYYYKAMSFSCEDLLFLVNINPRDLISNKPTTGGALANVLLECLLLYIGSCPRVPVCIKRGGRKTDSR